jgi:hypothetical protein
VSIATVVTRGFGSFGRTQAVARRGFAAFVALPEPPVAGKQYIDADLTGGLPSLSLFAGANPAVATGDPLIGPLLTDDGYALTLRSNGTVSIDSGGDLSVDHFLYDVYSVALGALHGQADVYVNDQPPQFTTAPVVYAFPKSTSITPVDLRPNWIDPENEAITVTQTASLGGFNVVSSFLTGTTGDVDSIDSLAIRGADPAGGFTDGEATIITGQVAIPAVKGLTLDGGESLLVSGFLNFTIGTAIFSDTVEQGLIADQSPGPDERADPYSVVTLYPSLGLTVVLPVNGQGYPTRRSKRNTQREEQDAEDRERLRTEVMQAAAASAAAEQMRAEAQKNAAKQIRIQTVLPAKFRGRR